MLRRERDADETFFFSFLIRSLFVSHGKNLIPFISLIKCPRVEFLARVPDEL